MNHWLMEIHLVFKTRYYVFKNKEWRKENYEKLSKFQIERIFDGGRSQYIEIAKIYKSLNKMKDF